MNETDMAAFLRKAQAQTLMDCAELLAQLSPQVPSDDQKRIADMIIRLGGMMRTL